MKCLETEKLISYAYRLMDEAGGTSEVRAHLGECPRCREIVEQHGGWMPCSTNGRRRSPRRGLTLACARPWRLQQAGREAWGFWGWGWARGLALASLGVLIVAGAVWFTQSHRRVSNPPRVAARQPQQVGAPQAPAPVASFIPQPCHDRIRTRGRSRPPPNPNRRVILQTKTKTPKHWKTMIWPRTSTYSRNFPRESHGLPTEPSAPALRGRRRISHSGRDLAWILLLLLFFRRS